MKPERPTSIGRATQPPTPAIGLAAVGTDPLPVASPAALIPDISNAAAVVESEPAGVAFAVESSPATVADSTTDAFDQLQLAARSEPANAQASQPNGAAESDGVAVPVYATAPAPSQVLRYKLQRGLLSGTGELSWRRDPVSQPGAKYELQLVAKVGGLSIMTQVSSGGFDQAGLAPLRFTDQRLRGSVRAANFQRQRGLISFSGPSVEYPLVRGAQDRLSWMMQLPAILAANPRLATPGQEVALYVVGARGDASLWVFRCEGIERVASDAGSINAVKLVRAPRKEHDTLAEVWLDPARSYLPLRARIGNPDDGAMLELLRIQD